MLNVAEINLKNLKSNAKKIKSLLNEKVKFCAVVKADAYGHGAVKCANAIYNLVDCFAVAILEEGVSLRIGGINKDILILNPVFKSDLERAVRFDFILSVDQLSQIKQIEKESQKQKRKTKLHLIYNTGMNRNGVDTLEELSFLAEYISNSKWLILDGLYSHFFSTDRKKLLIRSLNKFLLAIKVVKGYNIKATCHISASGGFLQGIELDMVRIGILLYGYTPYKTKKISVKPVMKIFVPVMKNRTLFRGDYIMYGTNKVYKKQKISIIRIGYADGFFRNKTSLSLNNRCMDLTAVKGTYKKQYLVMENAEILAKKHKTITYEILVKSTIRAEKIYVE